MFEDVPDHVATGSESLAEFARNAGMDNPDQCWLLDSRDVWVRNPFYQGPPEPHPEDDMGDFAFPSEARDSAGDVVPLDVDGSGNQEEGLPF